MQLLFLRVLHYLLFDITFAAPSGLMREKAAFNKTLNQPLLYDRSLKKREVFSRHGDPAFSEKLAHAIQDASNIVRVAVIMAPYQCTQPTSRAGL